MAEIAKFSVAFHCLCVQKRSPFLSRIARVLKMCFQGSFFPSLLRLHTLSVLLQPVSLSPFPRSVWLLFPWLPLAPSCSVCGAKCLSLQPSESPWSLLYIPWLIAAIEKWKPNLGKDLDVIEKEGFTLARTAVNRKAKLDKFFFFFLRRGGVAEGQWNFALWFKERGKN